MYSTKKRGHCIVLQSSYTDNNVSLKNLYTSLITGSTVAGISLFPEMLFNCKMGIICSKKNI